MNANTMPANKVLCIGNNTQETDDIAREAASKLNIKYNGLINSVNVDILDGLYHTSIEDLSISEIIQIVDKFDKINFFDQQNSLDQTARLLRLTFKNQIENIDTTFSKIGDNILFVGCSHTAGIGHKTKDTVYTKIFSDYLKQDMLVLGNPGKGNFLFEKILNSYSLTNTKVIVQFTDIFRLRYYDATGTLREIQGNNYSRNEVDFFTEEKLIKDFLELVNRIVIRLRDARSKFLFFQTSQVHSTNILINYQLSKYKEFCWIPDIMQDTANDNIHYGINSHQLIADRLFAQWNKLYV